MKKPEHVVKAFIRFALAQGAVMSGMELLTVIFSIVQGILCTVMKYVLHAIITSNPVPVASDVLRMSRLSILNLSNMLWSTRDA